VRVVISRTSADFSAMSADVAATRIQRLLGRVAVAQALLTAVLLAEATLLLRSGNGSRGVLTLGFAASTLWAAWFLRRAARGASCSCRVRTRRRTLVTYSLVATWVAFIGTMTAVTSGPAGLLMTFGPGVACAVCLLGFARRSRKRLATGLGASETA
jgi:hypothetical protein